jgi:hypothetical protein
VHPEVFDFHKHLSLISALKKDRESELKCPICFKTCPSFKFDFFLYNKIKSHELYK